MDLSILILLVVVAAAAYYMGYQQGRASLSTQRNEPEASPLPGPRVDHLPGPSAVPDRPRGAPPPAAAGEQDSPGASSANIPPRRTSKPPPAAAGLMDKGRAASDSSDKDNR